MGVTQSDVPVPEGMFGDGDERLFKALCCKAYGTCAVASGLDYKRVCKAKKTKGSLGAEEETRRAEEGRCKVSNRGGGLLVFLQPTTTFARAVRATCAVLAGRIRRALALFHTAGSHHCRASARESESTRPGDIPLPMHLGLVSGE